jgi:hypothetical protein
MNEGSRHTLPFVMGHLEKSDFFIPNCVKKTAA